MREKCREPSAWRRCEKSPDGSACTFIAKCNQLFLSVHLDDIHMAKKTKNMPKMWAHLQKQVDFEDPTSLLIRYILDVLSEQHKSTTESWWKNRNCSRSCSAQIQMSKLKRKKPKDITERNYDMECHAQNCNARFRDMAHKTDDQLHEVSTLCWYTITK